MQRYVINNQTFKICKVMKLTALIMLVACLQVGARGYTQERVTLARKDASLSSVLEIIIFSTRSGRPRPGG
jgi:hypothetical protein